MFRALLDIIRRNPLTTVILIMLFVAAPGLLGVFAIFLLIPLIFIIIGAVSLTLRMRRAQRDINRNFQNTQQNSSSQTRHGNVTVHIPPQQENRVSDDVGEYVEFREEK